MSEAPRLLLISFAPFPAATGAATRLAQRIATFAEAGYAVDVLTPKTPELPHVSKLMGSRILRVPMPTGRELRVAPVPVGMPPPSLQALRHAAFDRAIRRQLLSNEYDLIHTSDPFTALTVLGLRGAAKVSYDAPAGLAPTADHALAITMRRRDRELVRGADVVLVPSEVLALRAKGLGASPSAVHVLRPATDLDLFAPSGAAPSDSGQTVRVAVLAGSLSTAEFNVLLAASQAIEEELDVVFMISADVPASDRDRIAAAPGGHRLRVVAPVLYEDLGPFFADADMGLVLDAGPVQGHVAPPRLQCVAEMMAAGVAPVLPDVVAVREVAEHRKHALLVAPGDGAAIASAISGLVAQPARRQLLAKAARARAMELMDEATASHQLQSIYQRLLTPPSISVAIDPPRAPTTTASTLSAPTGGTSPSTTNRRMRPALSTAAVAEDPPTAPDAAAHFEESEIPMPDLDSVDVPLDDL